MWDQWIEVVARAADSRWGRNAEVTEEFWGLPNSGTGEPCEISVRPAARDATLDSHETTTKTPVSFFTFVLVPISAPVIEPLLGENGVIAAPLCLGFVLQVDDKGGGVMPDSGWR